MSLPNMTWSLSLFFLFLTRKDRFLASVPFFCLSDDPVCNVSCPHFKRGPSSARVNWLDFGHACKSDPDQCNVKPLFPQRFNDMAGRPHVCLNLRMLSFVSNFVAITHLPRNEEYYKIYTPSLTCFIKPYTAYMFSKMLINKQEENNNVLHGWQ